MSEEDKVKLVKMTIVDMVSDFLYYDRKEDESLPVGCIDNLIKDGHISIDELCELFKNRLEVGLIKNG